MEIPLYLMTQRAMQSLDLGLFPFNSHMQVHGKPTHAVLTLSCQNSVALVRALWCPVEDGVISNGSISIRAIPNDPSWDLDAGHIQIQGNFRCFGGGGTGRGIILVMLHRVCKDYC